MTSTDPDGWQTHADQMLMTVISQRRQITYNQLATAAGLTGSHRIHRLTVWLEQTMAEDHRCGRPIRAAVVISKARGGLPAPGFFSVAEQLGLSFSEPDLITGYHAYLDYLYKTLTPAGPM